MSLVSAFQGKLSKNDMSIKQYFELLFRSLHDNIHNFFADKRLSEYEISAKGNAKYMLVHTTFYLDDIYKTYPISATIGSLHSAPYVKSFSMFIKENKTHASKLSIEKTERDLRKILKSFISKYKDKYKAYHCFQSKLQNELLKNLQYIFVHDTYAICIILELKAKYLSMSIFYIPYVDAFNFSDIFRYCNINQDHWRSGCIDLKLVEDTLLKQSFNDTSLLSHLNHDIIKSKIMSSIKKGDMDIDQITYYINYYVMNKRRSPLPVLTRKGGKSRSKLNKAKKLKYLT